MTRQHRRILYPTAHHVGPFRVARRRQTRGFVIIDDRTGRPAWTEPHPVTGRPRALLVPRIAEALRIAANL
jgi:hypothetical protein